MICLKSLCKYDLCLGTLACRVWASRIPMASEQGPDPSWGGGKPGLLTRLLLDREAFVGLDDMQCHMLG